MHNLFNFSEFSFGVHMQPGLSFFYVIIYFEFNRSFFLSES